MPADVRNELVNKQNMPKQRRDTRKRVTQSNRMLISRGYFVAVKHALLMENQELECKFP